MVRAALPLAIVLALLGGAGPLVPARADALDPGTRRLAQEVRVDLGAWSDLAPWRYLVRKKDTLSEIAERHLGRARRQNEILLLNPGTDPRTLRAGAGLWMPPRRGPGWHFFVATSGDASPVRVGSGDAVALPHGGVRLYAVPQDRYGRLLASGKKVTASLLQKDPVVARSDPIFPMGWVEEGDATAKLVVAYRVASIEGSHVALARTGEERYGRGGVALAALAETEPSPEPLLLWTLGGIAALAVALLVLRWVRTRDAT